MLIKTVSHVAAAALFAGLAASSYAQTGGTSGGQGGASPGAGSQSSPSMQQKQPGGGGGAGGSSGMSGPAGRTPGAGGAPKQDSMERREGGSAERGGAEKDGKAAREERRGEKQQRTEDRQPSKSDGRQAKDRPAGEAKRGAGGGVGTRVDLSTEQRSTIRQRLSGGPRASNVNVSISVGSHIPRSVVLAPLPVAVIDVVPQYRGYRYFLVGNSIVIVDPRTLEIVAVLDA